MTDTSHTVAPDESRHYVERLSLVLSDMGFPPMPARVWAALMTSETPLVHARRSRISVGSEAPPPFPEPSDTSSKSD